MFSYQVVGEKDLEMKFQNLGKALSQPKMLRHLDKSARELRLAIMEEISRQGLVDSGDLRNSIKVTVGLFEVEVSTDIVYAAIHEYGGVVTARSGPLLKFSIGGEFVQVPSVYIPARPYFRPGIEKGKPKLISVISELIAKSIEGSI